MDDVAVADDVFFALDPHLSCFFALRFAAKGQQVFPPNDLRFDEATFKVSVNHTRCLRSSGTLTHRPSASFFLADGEKGVEAQEFITGLNHAV